MSSRRHRHPLGPLASIAMLLAGCATLPADDEVAALVERTVEAARAHQSDGRIAEAAVLLRAAERVAPEGARVAASWGALGDEGRGHVFRGALGSNRRVRAPLERSALERILLYPVDRVADALDVFGFTVEFGAGASLNAYVTRAVHFGYGLRVTHGAGLVEPRILGMQSELEVGVRALNWGDFKLVGRRQGSPGGIVTGAEDTAGRQRPSAPLYQDYRDYWAVGAGFTFVLVGASVEVHPVQIADLVLGIFGFDLANDDYATTRALALSPADLDALLDLSQVEEAREY